MAAYAALVSVMHIIEQIQHHPRPPISLYKNQTQSLVEKVTFLQEFLEAYSHVCNEEVDGLQSRIADAAYEAEDVIESHIVDQILAQCTTQGGKIGSALDFYLGLQKVIQDMNLIKKEVMEIQEKMGLVHDVPHHGRSSMLATGSSRSPPKGQHTMVGCDDVLIQLMDKLTGQQSNRQIIPIVGMGGIGKTMLATNAYEDPLIVEHFDFRALAIISQEYSVKEILLQLLLCQKNQDSSESLSQMSEEVLGERLYKSLWGRRYLILMDDMWSIDTWERVMLFLPDNHNGSRVFITTRLSAIALHFPSASGLEMNFLDEELSWNLLCNIVFGEDGCPLELEEIGKKIAQNCKGLPLSIVVIGGLLAKSKQTREYWKDIAENLNSIVNLEDNERCFKLLYTSYNHLPVHLKPCFLYIGVFPEDSEIRVSNLIKLWIAEGFLKPIIGKSLEETAEEYLKDLIDRNLIFVHKWGSSGKMKFCKIHDLLRDLCLREAQKEEFLCVKKMHDFDNLPLEINPKRCIAVHGSKSKGNGRLLQIHYPSQYASFVRSFICDSPIDLSPTTFRLLRVLNTYRDYSPVNISFQRVNLRYVVFNVPYIFARDFHVMPKIKAHKLPSSIYLLWNLQTLINWTFKFTIELGKIPVLRHVKCNHLYLQDPSTDEQNDFVLGNLQTLSNVVNFRCNEKMVKMIPNIKKLGIYYEEKFEGSHYCLKNLGRLHKLESIVCSFHSTAKPSRSDLMQNLTFPQSLKKLTLGNCKLHWEDISTKIGPLPLLQVLRLKEDSFIGPEWKTIEGQFLSLKDLQVAYCNDLECWTTEKTHFPRLEHLVLEHLYKLKEIPLDIGEIPTLQSLELFFCSNSAVNSAKEIAEEQEQLGNEDLQVQVHLRNENQVLESSTSHNFQVVKHDGDQTCTIQ